MKMGMCTCVAWEMACTPIAQAWRKVWLRHWSPKMSIEERQVHHGERGNKVTPSHKRKPITNSGPGMAKPRQALGIALSQPLLVPEGCARAVKRA